MDIVTSLLRPGSQEIPLVSASLSAPPRRAVIGLGNLFYSDEGMGVHAMLRLREQFSRRKGIDWFDGGVMGLDLLPLVEECSHLLVLDAIDAGLPPGRIIEIARDEIPYYRGVKLSEHQVGFQEVMALANARLKLPQNLILLGLQPADLSLSLELSPRIRMAFPGLLARAATIIEGW